MKAKTEINAIDLKNALNIRNELLNQKRLDKQSKPKLVGSPDSLTTDATIPEAPVVSPETQESAENVSDTSQDRPSETNISETASENLSHNASNQNTAEEALSSIETPETMAGASQEMVKQSSESKPSEPVNVEKRLAELKIQKEEAFQKKLAERAALQNEIKEPFAQIVKEKFAWTEEKTEITLQALDMIDPKRFHLLRKIRVLTIEKESEKLPTKDARKIGELLFVADYLPPIHAPQEDRGRDKKRGNKDKNKNKSKKPRRDFANALTDAHSNEGRPSRGPRKPLTEHSKNPLEPQKRTFIPRSRPPVEKTPPSGVGPKPILNSSANVSTTQNSEKTEVS